jgi:hypothetical protein
MDMQQMMVVNQQGAMATEIVIRNRDRLNLFLNVIPRSLLRVGAPPQFHCALFFLKIKLRAATPT